MRVSILNGNPDKRNTHFDQYISKLGSLLKENNHYINTFTLRNMDIKQCVGCFGCWIKTPGECLFKDESSDLCRNVINSDFVLFSSPIIMGFVSALLKKANEKLLPIFHPYFEFLNGEIRHIKRYKKYPIIGLLLEKNQKTDEEDISIISEIYRRDGMNFKSALAFSKLTSDPITELAHEISSI